jgi:hypothetical protein
MKRFDPMKNNSRTLPGAALALTKDLTDGGITLVLGSGVSISWGAPSWQVLVDRVLKCAGINQKELHTAHPPLLLEMAYRKLKQRRFVQILRREITAGAAPITYESLTKSEKTLAVIARVVADDYKLVTSRKLLRLITFNADDFMERSILTILGQDVQARIPVVKIISRASHHPAHGWYDRAIPIYHLHGYLPSLGSTMWHEEAADTLVFTDYQYWASGSQPASYANRVMLNALHDSHCVFIGMSMTDPNILRWTATMALEVEADKREQFKSRSSQNYSEVNNSIRKALRRHYWIRAENDSSSADFEKLLLSRGVLTVKIKSWEDGSLSKLLAGSFLSGSSVAV